MKYDFSGVLEGDSELIYTELRDRYLTCIESYACEQVIKKFYLRIINLFHQSFTSNDINTLYKELAMYKISMNVPYIIMTNEIYGLKNLLLSRIAQNIESNKILNLISLFKEINNGVAYIYLSRYTQEIYTVNNNRLSSLSDLLDKDIIIKHYEAHLKWLNELAKHINSFDKNDFPELDGMQCDFGLWLNNHAKKIIQNNSKLDVLTRLHNDLHMFAKKIFVNLTTSEYHVLISYLEKCELISLNIGTELALIDNIEMNKKMTKDNLTGALNRNSLELIFKTQYELSYATENSFVLAMCDLDYFKKINDTYGHVAGDKMLHFFVAIVKKHIRTSDIVIRYGGEEFMIILSAIQKEAGFKVLEKIRQAFEAAVLEADGQKLQATVSMGAMWIKPDKIYRHTLLDEYVMIVDKMLYCAKENGRNTIEAI
ncbi:sensor domain-containing diguanylate cyclase [Sulfurimonas sp. NWX367]|uniref:GGDEF domain-containing protein n=1 Tax=Sulfurimonas sp. NWX367 TaxID=2925413 RepID=UPI003204DC47